MKCLVTGGSGFIGSHLVDLLIKEGLDVFIIDNLSTGLKANLNRKATFIEGDIRDAQLIKNLCVDVDFVFHLAALPRIQPSFDQPIEHEEVNVMGTINCLQAVIGTSVRKFVFSSSSAIYGNTSIIPTPEDTPPDLLNPYALQKYAAEQYCLMLGQRFDIPVIALRYFNVYGPRSFNTKNPFNAYSSVFGIFNDQQKRKVPLTVTGDGEQRRDCVHVIDVARANLSAALSNRKLDVYNVGAGNNYSINQIARLFSSDITHTAERKGEARITVADVGKIARELKWNAQISVDDGIKQIIENK